MIKKMLLIICLLASLLLMTNCTNVLVESDVDYPAALFKTTMQKIDAIHNADPLRKGPVTQLNLLVYDGGDRQLVRFSVKKEVVANLLSGDNTIKLEELDELKKKCGNMSLEKLKNLESFGPGLVMEVNVNEENDKNTHVLIWLD